MVEVVPEVLTSKSIVPVVVIGPPVKPLPVATEVTVPPLPASALMVIDPPNETSPPPVNAPDVLMVIEEEDKAELGILVKVLEEPEIVLLVRVWEVVSKNKIGIGIKSGD